MRIITRLALSVAIISMCMGAVSCSKANPDNGNGTSGYSFNNCPDPSNVDPGIIEHETVSYNKSFNVIIPVTNVFEWKGEHFDVNVNTPQVNVSNLVDLHVEVLPLYVFGTNSASGDYYSVNGYVVVHNASCLKRETLYTTDGSYVEKIGWYMADLCLDAQLLDSDGNAVTNDNVTFLVTPEPSTTIGETTYTKGFSFSLSPALTFGKVRKTSEEGETSWKTIGLGAVSFGFGWTNTSTQVLPDQTVMMWTDTQDRTVSYDMKTNNLQQEAEISAIPSVARNDQRFDFSWVWKVKSGAYNAKDYDFGNMKMRITVTPKYETNVVGTCRAKWKEIDKEGKEKDESASTPVNKYFVGTDVEPLEYLMDLPAMNRIPTAKFTLKNCTTSYMTNIKVYREGEYGFAAAYDNVNGLCDQNESVESMVREGTYDIVYELFNGDTGESRGLFAISGVKFDANDDISLTTFDGKRL